MMRLFSLTALAVAAQAVKHDTASLSKCLDAASLTFVDPSSPNWDDAIQPYNLRLQWTPSALVYALAKEDVSEAVKCANKHGLRVTPKSGGHNYASFGIGGEDGHVVIQLDRMYDVELGDDGVANVQAGARLGHTALQLFDQGKRDIPHGTCPSVGVGGHVTGGGFGFSSRTHGLGLDAITGMNVVLANGTLVYASKDKHPDLFWAMRGAGSSFGIATDFDFEAFTVPEPVTYMKIDSKLPSCTKDEAIAGILAWQKILSSGKVDQKLNFRLALTNVTSQIQATYHGLEKDARKAFKPFEKHIKLDWASNKTEVHQGNWTAAVEFFAGDDPLNITFPYTKHDSFYTSNLIVKPMPKEAIAGYVDYWFDKGLDPDVVPWWSIIDVHGDPNSAVAKVPMDATAYAHRDKMWIMQFSSNMKATNNTAPGLHFVKGWMDSVKDNMEDGDWGRYFNYVDSEIGREEAETQYWASHLDKLKTLKAKYDPDQVFWNPQSIEPEE